MNKTLLQSTLRSNREIFSEIYANNAWQKSSDPNEKFFSGSGSHDENIIVPYINTVLQLITDNNIRNIVDLGCGDFWIMRHVLGALSEANYNFFYTGVDVVEELINYNAVRFNDLRIRFCCKDFSEDDEPLPDGQLLIIRQVFQHIRNGDIKKILDKSKKFKYLFITEHIYDAPDAVYNVDKPASDGIRLSRKSGIYLEHAPFNIKNLVHLLKVPADEGIIRSSLIIN